MRATYRLQLSAGFTFADAAAVVPYLAELGISHLYLSPVLQAADGSTHGYDVVDPERASAALGGDAGFTALAIAAHQHGLEILLDIVPNHMSIAGTGNRWWLDVLENGPASYYAHYFDVDWPSGDDRVLLPVLPERYGRSLAAGQLGVIHDGAGGFAVRANTLRFPLAPHALGRIVRRAGERIGHAELGFVGDSLVGLPRLASPGTTIDARRRRHRDKAVLARRLAELTADPACARALDAEVAALTADPVELDAILELQAYRLAHWSVAGSQLTYRRFFDVNTLVGIRNEEPDVFAASHARILGWLVDRTIAGVRIDHVDGLRDPERYLIALRERAPRAWIVVEKILARDEHVPDWPVDGTTGYDHAERIGALLVDPAGEASLTQTFEAYTGLTWDPAAGSRVARRDVMTDALHSELARLGELAARACAASPACRDYTRAEIDTALAEILAGYPTYRTYARVGEIDPADRRRIAAAVAAVTDVDRDLLAFLEAALAFELTHPDAVELARAAQQVTGAIVAKGDEDTQCYRAVRLASRCEVGADLQTFAADPEVVHAALAAGTPRAMLASSTHDSKRGEDVRARIAAISEVPAQWRDAVTRWRARSRWDVEPDRVLEYLMWQTLVGAWPIELPRAQAYALKAAREARLRTSWRHPDEAYEAAVARWLAAIYADSELVIELGRFAAAIAPRGDANALAQLLIKLVAPGVPDFYQGSELAHAVLVDPDNRRAVDFAMRRDRLRAIADASVHDVRADLGLAKLWTIRRVLGLRRRQPKLFTGPYTPLGAVGPGASRVFAFSRGTSLIAIVPRLGPIDLETAIAIPDGDWLDVLADRTLRGGSTTVASLWSRFPIALLAHDTSRRGQPPSHLA